MAQSSKFLSRSLYNHRAQKKCLLNCRILLGLLISVLPEVSKDSLCLTQCKLKSLFALAGLPADYLQRAMAASSSCRSYGNFLASTPPVASRPQTQNPKPETVSSLPRNMLSLMLSLRSHIRVQRSCDGKIAG